MYWDTLQTISIFIISFVISFGIGYTLGYIQRKKK